ncbi:MAG: NAD(P)H-hydrate epimerase [Endomicrobia bacterium]|nr:NAD(P)H-hydrate epimerase [Endomicrobiia bacterium]
MRKIYYTTKQIYKIDKLTTKKFLIPSIILMENAGHVVAEFVKKHIAKNKTCKVLVFCGPGKNGGDGFVCARYLSVWGFVVKVITFVEENNYNGDTLLNYKILKKIKVGIEKFNYEKVKILVRNVDVIVDAIFGIGITRNIEGDYYYAIDLINNSKKTVLSIDIPSGLNADSGEIMGVAVKSNYTLTMGFQKIGFKYKSAKKFLGKLILCDIGYPEIKV